MSPEPFIRDSQSHVASPPREGQRRSDGSERPPSSPRPPLRGACAGSEAARAALSQALLSVCPRRKRRPGGAPTGPRPSCVPRFSMNRVTTLLVQAGTSPHLLFLLLQSQLQRGMRVFYRNQAKNSTLNIYFFSRIQYVYIKSRIFLIRILAE